MTSATTVNSNPMVITELTDMLSDTNTDTTSTMDTERSVWSPYSSLSSSATLRPRNHAQNSSTLGSAFKWLGDKDMDTFHTTIITKRANRVLGRRSTRRCLKCWAMRLRWRGARTVPHPRLMCSQLTCSFQTMLSPTYQQARLRRRPRSAAIAPLVPQFTSNDRDITPPHTGPNMSYSHLRVHPDRHHRVFPNTPCSWQCPNSHI